MKKKKKKKKKKINGYENTFFIDQLFNASCHYGSM